MTQIEIADIIVKRLEEERQSLSTEFNSTEANIGYFVLDDLLPEELVRQLDEVFPDATTMTLKKSLREYKYVSAQMNTHHELLEQVLYAFQDKRVVQMVKEICGIKVPIHGDESLYAGGISLMEKGCYLNPHLDNSHDNNRDAWRVLNLLYYVSSDWKSDNGGNLELWPRGLTKDPVEVVSRCNRLVVMATHCKSWHSVNEVRSEEGRKCISNYYFSKSPLTKNTNFHVTTFRGWPHQRMVNFVLCLDSKLRMGIRKVFSKGIKKNPHVYKKDD